MSRSNARTAAAEPQAQKEKCRPPRDQGSADTDHFGALARRRDQELVPTDEQIRKVSQKTVRLSTRSLDGLYFAVRTFAMHNPR